MTFIICTIYAKLEINTSIMYCLVYTFYFLDFILRFLRAEVILISFLPYSKSVNLYRKVGFLLDAVRAYIVEMPLTGSLYPDTPAD